MREKPQALKREIYLRVEVVLLSGFVQTTIEPFER